MLANDNLQRISESFIKLLLYTCALLSVTQAIFLSLRANFYYLVSYSRKLWSIEVCCRIIYDIT